jgi:hypothetical protein
VLLPVHMLELRWEDLEEIRVYTGPSAIDAAARPMRPPFRACGWWTW